MLQSRFTQFGYTIRQVIRQVLLASLVGKSYQPVFASPISQPQRCQSENGLKNLLKFVNHSQGVFSL